MVQIQPTSGLTGTAIPSHSSTSSSSHPTIALEHLSPRPEPILCPSCNQHSTTRVEGRGKGMKRFMNVMWWPLPNRRQWWEKTHWFCEACGEEVATQVYGHDVKPGKAVRVEKCEAEQAESRESSTGTASGEMGRKVEPKELAG